MCIDFFISIVQLSNKVTKMHVQNIQSTLVRSDTYWYWQTSPRVYSFPFLLLTFPFSGIPTVIVVDWWKVGETKHEISWLFLVLYSKFGVKYDKIKKITNPSLPLFSGCAKENIGYCQHSWTFQHCYEINWQESHTGISFWISLLVKYNIPHSGDWLV